MSNPLVSIIIVNWNGENLIAECLDSVFQSLYNPFEVIVVDNGSTDRSLEIVKKYKAVRVIETGKNLGYAGGNNQGIKVARGKYIVFLNNDIVVDPEWLDGAVIYLESHCTVGVISCRQMNYFDKSMIDGLYHYLTRWLGFLPMGAGQPMAEQHQFSRLGQVVSANGGSAIFRKQMLDAIGLFDERLFAYCEETDLCMRALLHGWQTVYLPQSVVYHKGGASFGRNPSA
jgi:GT2 family glycosyltransferase